MQNYFLGVKYNIALCSRSKNSITNGTTTFESILSNCHLTLIEAHGHKSATYTEKRCWRLDINSIFADSKVSRSRGNSQKYYTTVTYLSIGRLSRCFI